MTDKNKLNLQNKLTKTGFVFSRQCLTVCVSGVWAGVENVREQKKLEGRKMPENAAESHTSTARFVGTLLTLRLYML